MAFKLEGNYSNNQIEYEALIIGLEMLLEMRIKSVEVYGDSQLVIRQLTGDYKCYSTSIAPYFVAARQLLEQFSNAKLNHVPRSKNEEANRMAQSASGHKETNQVAQIPPCLSKRILPSVIDRELGTHVFHLDTQVNDWRNPIIDYLKNPSGCTNNALKLKARKFVLIRAQDETLFKRGVDGILLKCISDDESKQVLAEFHEGICGPH